MKHLSVKNRLFGLILLIAFFSCNNSTTIKNEDNKTVLTKTDEAQLTYILPSPDTEGNISVENALNNRRSRREFQDKALSANHLSQILWAAYGVTAPIPDRPILRGGLRTAPSAGARYPLEIYAVIGNVEGIEPGVYRYVSEEHKIVRTVDNDIREQLCEAALEQNMVKEAPVCILYTAIYDRITDRYGDRGRDRYVCIEIGHSAQNIYLQAETLQLGVCAIGAFIDESVSQVLQLQENEAPLYILPIGYYKLEK